MRAPHRRWRGWLWPMISLLTGTLGACGGSATSHPTKASAGAASAGRSGANAAGDSGTNGASGGENNQLGGGVSAGGASAGIAGTGGASGSAAGGSITDDGGAAGESTAAGAGGSNDCVDVCQLRGQACCVPVSCVTPDASCVLDVFEQQVAIQHEYASLEQAVAKLQETFLASVGTAEIVSSAAEPFPASRIELRLSAAASSQYGAALEAAVLHPFRVSCAGKRLFVGLVYQREGAAALELPVLHVARGADDAIVLRLGAWQSAWSFPNTGDVAARARLDAPELRGALCLNAAPEAL